MNRRLHVGTSGWSYDDWAGVFYPEGVKGSGRLPYYATIFDTVEINATFYRLPSQTMIDAWNRNLPDGFHLVVKGSRTITHLKKLQDCDEPLGAFWDRVRRLRALRVVLWQLPPSLAKDLDRLDAFLARLSGLSSPSGETAVRHAVEFRHASWWDDEVTALVERHAAALVAVSHPGLPGSVHPTADFLYVRFHGLGKQLYRYDYSHRDVSDWAARLAPHLGGRELYAFFNNDYAARAPRNAVLFRELLGAQDSA